MRQGFEVTAGQTVEVHVTDRGPAVQPADTDGSFILSVNPNHPAAEIFLVNQRLALKSESKRVFSSGLPFGLYKIKLRIGREINESIFLLDRDVDLKTVGLDSNTRRALLADPAADLSFSKPQLSSAAPLAGTALTHEYQEAAWGGATALRPARLLETVSPRAPSAAALRPAAEVRLMARVWTGSLGGLPGAKPWSNVELVGADGEVLSRLGDLPTQSPESDPFVTARIAVLPGSYFLRHHLADGRTLEQVLVAPKGWALQIFLLAVVAPDEPVKVPSLNLCTILMSRVGKSRADARMDGVLESARIALVDERHVLNDELERLLLQKFQNPLAGILGAHLLLMEHGRTGGEAAGRLAVLDEVVMNLRRLVGRSHPDVEAISLRCPSENLRAREPFHTPPMFERSWRLVLAASESRPELVPEALWGRIHATTNLGGYLAWACDPKSQAAHLQQLTRWVETIAEEAPPAQAGERAVEAMSDTSFEGLESARRSRKAAEEVPSELARQLQIPAAAFASLWRQAEHKHR